MKIGASSSCFYPLETEKSLVRLGEVGIKTAEVFFNAFSELEKDYLKELCKIRDYYGMDIVSFHPFMCFAEGYNIFSAYRRRYDDSLEIYKHFFEAAAVIGAKYYVMHGSKTYMDITHEEYAERFGRFCEVAEHYGVTVAHENVVDYVGQTPEFMQYLKNILGDRFKMVLDVKQARRAKVDPFRFIETVGESIVHLHLSDCSATEDCLPPKLGGNFDFKRLFAEMKKLNYDGNCIVELYKRNFSDDRQLIESVNYLEAVLSQ
ncbi:MAG: sugar phosphate isomerase/epimerase [Faecalibacterium sp.]|nr:sugar phosphate isomerase/epimerase [Ruminococcus sp.]MCM1393236.1 sugar phosphate isomerase/epimerase [Ruminococcus sp.]MCM1486697.1 sugar phosphate isomerase/epimerase [Faecalibacterium sp.]